MYSLSPLAGQLYRFYQAVDKATKHPLGGMSRIPDLKAHSWDNVKWFSQSSNIQKGRLKNFLIHLDEKERVDPNSERRIIVLQGVTQIMNTICSKIEELEPRFKGKLVPMGSSHNNTKIGDPDEFDFSYVLDIATLLKEKGSFQKLERDDSRTFLYVDVEEVLDLDLYQFPKDQMLLELTSMNGSKDADYYRSAIGTKGDNYVLNTEHVAFAFYSRLQEALSDIHLPPAWCHGGFNRPNFSGVRFSLPSFMIQFVYEGTGSQSPICVSVDFVPVLHLERMQLDNHPDALNEFLWDKNYAEKFWFRLERGYFKTAFYSPAEENLLAEYPAESVPKVAIRLSKALHSLAKLNSPKYPPKFLVEEAVEFIKEQRSDTSKVEMFNLRMLDLLGFSQNLTHLLPGNEFVTYDDLGETAGHFEYVTSYMFKRTVMTLLALDETHGHDWTLDDLPDLIMSIFMIINDIILSVNQSMTIPVNEVYSEDGSSLTFSLAPRSDVLSAKGLYGHLEAPVLVGEVLVPLQVASDEPCATETPAGNQNANPSARFNPNDVQENSVGSAETKTNIPRFYTMLKSAITEQKCHWLISLFLRSNISMPIMDVGLDVGISQVFQLLHCVCEGQDTAKISIFRLVGDEDEQDYYNNINDYLVTKEEFKRMLLK